MPEILPSVHRIESEFAGRQLACHLLVGEHVLLIDSGLGPTPAGALFPYFDQIGLPVNRIDWIVVTHASGDHFGGNGAIRQRSPGTRIVAHELDAASISSHRAMIAEHFDALARDGVPVPDVRADDPGFLDLHGPEVPVDQVVKGGEWLELGPNWRVQLLHVPGHTPGHLMVHDPLHNALLVGDAVLGAGVPSLAGDLTMPPPYFDVNWYRGSVQTARNLHAGHLLATHYPPYAGGQVAEFLDASDEFIDTFGAWVRETLRASGRPMEIPELVAAAAKWMNIADADYQFGMTLRAHLRYLTEQGQAVESRAGGLPRWSLTSM